MPQIFHRSTNTIAKVSIFGGVFILAFLGWVYSELLRSHYVTGQNVVKPQPVPFSHEHHVAQLGIPYGSGFRPNGMMTKHMARWSIDFFLAEVRLAGKCQTLSAVERRPNIHCNNKRRLINDIVCHVEVQTIQGNVVL